jgi:hypothetical protein
MDNVAEAMGTCNRIYSTAGLSDPAQGTVLKETTCVKTAWPWVTYSTVFVLLLLSFFVSMI